MAAASTTNSVLDNNALIVPQTSLRNSNELRVVTPASHPLLLSTTENDKFIQCPSCKKNLQHFEVATHCEQEIQRLKEMSEKSAAVLLGSVEGENVNANEKEEGQSSTSSGNSPAVERRKPWTVFQKVQRNRQSRMKQRTRKRPAAPEQICPVCNVSFPQDDIQEHAEACLRRSNRTANGRSNSDDHSSNDGDEGGGEEYEEYEWAGQKRIRVSSLLQGGYAALGIGQPLRNGSSNSSSAGSANNRLNGHDEDDEDLNVDEDDTQIYGPAQYGESDVIPTHIMNEDESDITSYMRRLITAGSSNIASASSTIIRETNTTTTDSLHLSSSIADTNDVVKENTTAGASATNLHNTTTPAQYQQIIDSLKAKLQYYEQQHIPGKYKCLICLDDYRNPAISVACWHVHCEQCWLRSLGARKLCPQCNLITTPKDLRRIYM